MDNVSIKGFKDSMYQGQIAHETPKLFSNTVIQTIQFFWPKMSKSPLIKQPKLTQASVRGLCALNAKAGQIVCYSINYVTT